MGRPKPSTGDLPPYRDDPSLEDAVSLHTTQGDEDDLPQFNPEQSVAVPPPYSDDDVEQPLIEENQFAGEPEGIISKANDGRLSVSHPAYDKNAQYLHCSIKAWSKVPPAIHVRILGTHSEKVKKGDKTETQKVTDFDMKLRLTEYFLTHATESTWRDTATVGNDTKAFRGTVFKTKPKKPADEENIAPPTLKDWCEDYCENKATLKRFMFTRTIGGLDQKFLEENLTSLIRNTNYRGHLQISFPIDNPSVEVYSYHWVNRARHNTLAIILSVITATILFIWPIITLMTKRYDVVKVVWWFSMEDGSGSGNRSYATMSEAQWFNRWSRVIEKNALRHRQGLLTEEDLTRVDEPEPQVNSGNSYLDAAASLVGAGVHAYREVNRQLGWGYDR